MALTSASTDAQVEAEYDDNADYDEDVSPSKAKLFIIACRYLLRRLASSIAKGGSALGYDRRLIQQELEAAKAWLCVNDTSSGSYGPRVTRPDFRNIRS
jgi:hypothetical protein